MKNVACYVRVSTEEQKRHGLSVDAQITALTEYCEKMGYHIVDVYNDAGISARKTYKKRFGLLRMIQDCKAKKIDLILMTKLDRFFRSVKDYYAVMEQIGEVPWKAIWEDYETETSAGMLKVNIMLSVAQSEADRTSERIKSTFAYKKSKGEYIGGNKAPVGYLRNGKQLVIDPDTCEAVRAFFSAYLSSFSRAGAIRAAEDKGLSLNVNIAMRMLSHPAYYGGLAYCKETYISEADHKAIESKRNTTKHYGSGYDYMFSGLLKCATCGRNMVSHRVIQTRKDGSKHHIVNYTCHSHEARYNCPGASINEKWLEKYLIENLDHAVEEYNLALSASTSQTKAAELDKAKAKMKRLATLYEFGDIELEEYRKKRTLLIDTIHELEKEPVQKMRELPPEWLSVYNELDIPHRRAFWSRVLSYIRVEGFSCKKPIIIFD